MKKLLFFLLALAAVVPVEAQIRGNSIRVTVVPDHKDWNYRVGETASFTVSVTRSSTLVDNVTVDYEAGPEMYPDVKKQGVVLKDGTMKWKGKMTKPGFYRLAVKAYVDGKTYTGCCTAAFSPEQLRPTTVNPDDFDSFWSNTLAEARQTPLNASRTFLPERSNEDVNVYQVSFNNIRWGSRTYGILSIPTKPGKYPALLRVPGAGVRPYAGDTYTAPTKAIVLEIGIHGVDVTQPQAFYDDLMNGAVNCYWTFGLDNRDESYYKRVVVGSVRSIDYIASLPEWNGKAIGVTGSSQGGFLSLATAALDKRVTFYGAVHAALCDHTASLQKVACGWPHYFYGQKNPDPKKVETSRYYDGVNFARRITCPGWFSFGYNDDVVPPTTAYATYNIVTGPKELSLYQETAHFWFQEQWEEWQNWLSKQMGIENN
ncbi:MAG: acetylxylan esterase [Prevotella sp.]|nr:acetylxylan esterase [Prevotella sp.]